jgi:hypothetical protein
MFLCVSQSSDFVFVFYMFVSSVHQILKFNTLLFKIKLSHRCVELSIHIDNKEHERVIFQVAEY